MKILLTEPYVEATDVKSINRLREFAEVRIAHNTSEETLFKEVEGACALIVRFAKITKKIIDNGSDLKVIAKTGTGVDNIDVDAATERGIFVCNVPALNADAVAEYTFSLILTLSKNLFETDNRLRIEGWAIRDQLWPNNIELRGKVLGIIGFGAIGSRVSNIAKAFDMKIIIYDPFISAKKAVDAGVKQVDLDRLLSTSDFVTIHCSLNDETINLLSREKIRLMKRKAFLINCGRGPIVNQNDLIDALNDGIISGAALDVFESEPLTLENPLLKFKNVIVTPHIAGLTYDVRVKTMNILFNDVISILSGKKPKNIVNTQILEKVK